MNREAFKTQLSELFPGENLNLLWSKSMHSREVILNTNRELSRMDLGHLFSLGVKSIKKRPLEGLSITFDLDKASVNQIYTPQIIK